jgi:acyl dehydratase
VRRRDVRFELVELPRVRFIAPLPIGHRVRDHLKVAEAVEEPGDGGSWRVRTQHTVEREGLERPFMFAELVTRYSEI